MLRRFLFICAFVVFLALCSASGAKADDLFTYTSGSNTYSWELPASLTITPPNLSSTKSGLAFFELETVPFSINGVLQSFDATIDFYSSNDAPPGGFELFPFTNSAPILNTVGDQLYMGSEGSPTFILGTFTLTNETVAGAVLGTGTLTIGTAPGSAATPEPGSLLLLGSGALALAVFIRKKTRA